MDEDDARDKIRKQFSIGMDLSELSVEELQNTIVLLREEIARLDAAAQAKSDHLSAAQALFKS